MKSSEFLTPFPAPVQKEEPLPLQTRRELLKKGSKLLGAPVIAGLLASCGITSLDTGRNPLIPETTPQPPDTGRHPLVPQSPQAPEPTRTPDNRPSFLKDIVPATELAQKYNTRIADINVSPTDYVRLSLRRGALATSPYKELPGSKNSLTICLVNGPTIQEKYLTDEQKEAFPDLKNIFAQTEQGLLSMQRLKIRNARVREVHNYNTVIKSLDSQLQTGNISSDDYELKKQELAFDYRVYLTNEPEDEDVLEPIMGVYTYKTKPEGNGQSRYIFLPVRDHKDITFTSSNGHTLTKKRSGNDFQLLPNPEQSYPNTSKIIIDLSNPTYHYVGNHRPGLNLRHEVGHAAGLEHPAPDDKMFQDIDAAWKKLQMTGDDSGYFYVFETYPYLYTVTRDPHPIALPLPM